MAYPHFRRLGKKSALAAVGFAIFTLFVFTSLDLWGKGVDSSSKPPIDYDSHLVDLTLVRNATDRGAVCLDGTPPGYHFQKGFGSGLNNWLLHIEGGGWCNSVSSCSARTRSKLGSSNFMEHKDSFYGILSHDQSQNPDFYNWNKVKIRYCDGGSFSGNSKYEDQNETKLFFRGQLIWEAIMDELLSMGLANAGQALLSGCSAGGLATLIHCDDFRALLPMVATVKCLADGALFLDEIQHVLAPDTSDPHNAWLKCKMDIRDCSSNQIERLQGFRTSMLKTLSSFQHNKDGGLLITSCYIHCQTWMTSTWHSSNSPRINNKTIAEAFGDWYFNRREVKEIDCPYPCNPTCFNMVFSELHGD